ncbi:MAG: TPM domain-containing protein [Pseudomonadota bacterium]|nr:TPM domain-containing protein [Pseudomonadota bacterium]
MTLFSQKERQRISRAIAQAEKKTSGEIVTVVADSSDDYTFIPVLWAALAALALPMPLIFLAAWPLQDIYSAQLLVFLVFAAAAQWWPLRVRLVPGRVKRARAHRHAVEQFLAQNLHTTAKRTGVLIFVSLAERYAEVIADKGINDKAPQGLWDGIVAELTAHLSRGEAAEGFVGAINGCGAILAQHFPPGSADENELPNHLIVLQRD